MVKISFEVDSTYCYGTDGRRCYNLKDIGGCGEFEEGTDYELHKGYLRCKKCIEKFGR